MVHRVLCDCYILLCDALFLSVDDLCYKVPSKHCLSRCFWQGHVFRFGCWKLCCPLFDALPAYKRHTSENLDIFREALPSCPCFWWSFIFLLLCPVVYSIKRQHIGQLLSITSWPFNIYLLFSDIVRFDRSEMPFFLGWNPQWTCVVCRLIFFSIVFPKRLPDYISTSTFNSWNIMNFTFMF